MYLHKYVVRDETLIKGFCPDLFAWIQNDGTIPDHGVISIYQLLQADTIGREWYYMALLDAPSSIKRTFISLVERTGVRLVIVTIRIRSEMQNCLYIVQYTVPRTVQSANIYTKNNEKN